MPQCACAKGTWQSVCVSVYLFVCNLDFSKVTKNQAPTNAVQALYNNILNLIVLDSELRLCSLVMV